MPEVNGFESRLGHLNAWWEKITLIGKINSHNIASTILDDMNRTQSKFGELQRKLTDSLLFENLQKLVLDNSSRAQVAIDLLIRNLFERTADVGFLATDDDIRVFLRLTEPDTDQIEFIENRLKEYVKKYSVYEEIIILDTKGQVKAHLDASNPISRSTDPLIKATLTSDQPYLETFRHSELQKDRLQSLIYSCKVTDTNEKSSPALGVLCLCFKIHDEIESIFADLLPHSNHQILSILSAEGQVIASSNEQILPINSKFRQVSSVSLANFQQHSYIVNKRPTNGYQGFYGLGWCGQMMTRLDLAFKHEETAQLDQSHAEIIEQSNSFPQELKDIRKASLDINTDLGLLVLNGQIASARKNASEFMPVLEAIKQVGSDIANIFTASVNRLQEVTVMSSHLNNAGFLASLAVDIMDRNLYERANDCRWWALTSIFRRQLAKSSHSEIERQELSDILRYINDLYTVYTNLYLYNVYGEIIAVSNPEQSRFIGTKADENSGFREALNQPNSQSYRVSGFISTELYDNRHTYLFNAAITDLYDNNKVLGGIGIIFDSEPQFAEMLLEILPKAPDGTPIKQSFAVLADRKRMILSVLNHPLYRIGERLPLGESYFKLANGQTSSTLIKHEGKNYVLGTAASKGYREFKTKDGYQNDVIALVFIPL